MADDRSNAVERFFEKHPSGNTRKLYRDIKKKIRKLDEGRILCVPRLRYVAFKPNHDTKRNFVHLHLRDDSLEFYLRLEHSETGNKGENDYHSGKHLKFIVENDEQIPGMIDLIEKSRKKLLGSLSSN